MGGGERSDLPEEAGGRGGSREPQLQFTVITGLSGAGRSEAARALEDLGYFVIDNFPPALVGKLAELAQGGAVREIALVVDVRGRSFFAQLAAALEELEERGIPYRLLFLEASDEVLVRRFEASRRPHPLAPEGRVVEGIAEERRVLAPLRGEADIVLDTSSLTPRELRERIRTLFSREERPGMVLNLTSFGYKWGVPTDADIVLDVRFLPNPHWVESLRSLPGTDRRVREYVLAQPAAREFIDRVVELLTWLIPHFESEGKSYLTVGFGCTGGKHRSVVVLEEVASRLERAGYRARVEHRDLARE